MVSKTSTHTSFRLRRFFAVLGFVLGNEFFFAAGIADETLRFGAVMFLAPITAFFTLVSDFFVTKRTDVFWKFMFKTPTVNRMVVMMNGSGGYRRSRCFSLTATKRQQNKQRKGKNKWNTFHVISPGVKRGKYRCRRHTVKQNQHKTNRNQWWYGSRLENSPAQLAVAPRVSIQ